MYIKPFSAIEKSKSEYLKLSKEDRDNKLIII